MEKRIDQLNKEERFLLERTAREQMKLKLLADIRASLIVCDLEGWDKTEYIQELQELLNSFDTQTKTAKPPLYDK